MEREAHEREQEGRRRAADERMRIARELHDTLAHSLVAINVRAGVAVDLRDSQDPAVALQDIKQVSATALRDLRATLSLLREQSDAAPTAPAFDFQALPGLVDHARAAGLRADVDVGAGGAVVPSASSEALDVEITDDGRAGSAVVGAGLGLHGMAERATALGGCVDVGPRDEGGWRVHAVLPLGCGGR